MADQNDVTDLGGTLRLGNWPCHIEAGSKVASLYGETEIVERHRHRYEFNNDYRKPLNEVGVKFSGVSPDNKLVRNYRIYEPPLLCRLPVPPRVQIKTE